MERGYYVVLSRHFFSFYGGGESCDLALLQELSDIGDVLLVAERSASHCDIRVPDGVSVRLVNPTFLSRGGRSNRVAYYLAYFLFSLQARAILLRTSIRAVFVSGPPTILFPFLGLGVVASFHGKIHRSWRPFVYLLSGVVDYGMHNQNLKSVRLAINPPVLDNFRSVVLRRLSDLDSVNAICVSRLLHGKGIQDAIDLAIANGISLDIFGSGNPRLFDSQGSNSICFSGYRNLSEIDFSKYDFLFSLSVAESYNMVIREVGYAGLPSLVLESADPKHYIVDGINGARLRSLGDFSVATITQLRRLERRSVRAYAINAAGHKKYEIRDFVNSLS